MIDEKKLIDDLKESGMIADNDYGNTLVEFIENQQKIGIWIPCSEKLPEITVNDMYSEDVLTVLKWYDGDITYSVGWYNKGGCWNEDGENHEVIAWMPIQEAYVEK